MVAAFSFLAVFPPRGELQTKPFVWTFFRAVPSGSCFGMKLDVFAGGWGGRTGIGDLEDVFLSVARERERGVILRLSSQARRIGAGTTGSLDEIPAPSGSRPTNFISCFATSTASSVWGRIVIGASSHQLACAIWSGATLE